jgi:Ca-activated chloride channel family protein
MATRIFLGGTGTYMRTQNRAGRHARPVAPRRRRLGLLAVLAVVALATAAIVAWRTGDSPHSDTNARLTGSAGSARPTDCPNRTLAVTATSFAPVLRQVAQGLVSGRACVDVQLTVADGQSAAGVVAATAADVWIPDDASWRNLPNRARFAPGGGITIATSPMYFVMDAGTAAGLPAAARTWRGLATELAAQGSTRLVMRNPATSGDGLVPSGALTYAVIEASGPLISAYDLMRAWQAGTTASDGGPALPTRTGEVGLVPEYSLLRSGRAGDYTVVAPSDDTALMRFTWNPTVSGMADPRRSSALSQLRAALTGKAGSAAFRAFDLRGGNWPAAAPDAAVATHLPPVTAPPMEVTVEHAMWHALTTWNPAQRTANVLVVVDVSGSMGDVVHGANGTSTPLIDFVRQGVGQVTTLLPDSARVGLWRFGSQLAPPQDYQQLVATGPLTRSQRAKLATATAGLAAERTGTGLYDTVLAAYRYQQAHFQPQVPNEIVLFTDGVNENDPASISRTQLQAALAAADPGRPVQIGIFAFGKRLPTDALAGALAPVGGQVDPLTDAGEVVAAFVHAVSGGLTH